MQPIISFIEEKFLCLILLYIGYKNENWISDLKNNCIMASNNTTIANN